MTGTINFRHRLGTCVSAHRTMEIRHEEAKAVCKRWNEDGVVYPTNVVRGVFVVCGSDNVDVSGGRVDFHGTASSLTASPTLEDPGTGHTPLSYEFDENDKIKIPDQFTTVPHVDEYAGDYQLTPLPEHLRGKLMKTDDLERKKIPEESWLQHVCKKES